MVQNQNQNREMERGKKRRFEKNERHQIINDTVDNDLPLFLYLSFSLFLSNRNAWIFYIFFINYNEYFVASCSNQVLNFSNANQHCFILFSLLFHSTNGNHSFLFTLCAFHSGCFRLIHYDDRYSYCVNEKKAYFGAIKTKLIWKKREEKKKN